MERRLAIKNDILTALLLLKLISHIISMSKCKATCNINPKHIKKNNSIYQLRIIQLFVFSIWKSNQHWLRLTVPYIAAKPYTPSHIQEPLNKCVSLAAITYEFPISLHSDWILLCSLECDWLSLHLPLNRHLLPRREFGRTVHQLQYLFVVFLLDTKKKTSKMVKPYRSSSCILLVA